MNIEIRPVADAESLRDYIDRYWRKGHILAADQAIFDFTYRTPWVDRDIFPAGLSVVGLYEGETLLGFLGNTVAPYPRPQSYWGSLWHVHESLKGRGWGGRLLDAIQAIADQQDGWYGGFGAGPKALPVYLKRGYVVRGARRWVYEPGRSEGEFDSLSGTNNEQQPGSNYALHSLELTPNEEWIDFRFRKHPRYQYEIRPGGVFRTEHNTWGTVTHVCMLGADWRDDVHDLHLKGSHLARRRGNRYLMDLWAFESPGRPWFPADDKLPSVFHPPEARGDLIYAIGKPFLVSRVHKGDGDQDRPYTVLMEATAETAAS